MPPTPPTEFSLILGVDPGTQITGYGVIRVQHLTVEPIDFGCIRPPQSKDTAQRYLVIFNAMERLIEEHQPHAVSIETQFVYKNAQSAIKLGMARAAAMLAAARRGIPVFEYSPTKAKKAVVGNGAASKEQVQKMLQLLLKLPSLPEPEDASDALALAICHAHTLNIKR